MYPLKRERNMDLKILEQRLVSAAKAIDAALRALRAPSDTEPQGDVVGHCRKCKASLYASESHIAH
jgi:hypothetical protein